MSHETRNPSPPGLQRKRLRTRFFRVSFDDVSSGPQKKRLHATRLIYVTADVDMEKKERRKRAPAGVSIIGGEPQFLVLEDVRARPNEILLNAKSLAR